MPKVMDRKEGQKKKKEAGGKKGWREERREKGRKTLQQKIVTLSLLEYSI